MFHFPLGPHPQNYADKTSCIFGQPSSEAPFRLDFIAPSGARRRGRPLKKVWLGSEEALVPGCKKHALYVQLSVMEGHSIFRLAGVTPNNDHEGLRPAQIRQN